MGSEEGVDVKLITVSVTGNRRLVSTREGKLERLFWEKGFD